MSIKTFFLFTNKTRIDLFCFWMKIVEQNVKPVMCFKNFCINFIFMQRIFTECMYLTVKQRTGADRVWREWEGRPCDRTAPQFYSCSRIPVRSSSCAIHSIFIWQLDSISGVLRMETTLCSQSNYSSLQTLLTRPRGSRPFSPKWCKWVIRFSFIKRETSRSSSPAVLQRCICLVALRRPAFWSCLRISRQLVSVFEIQIQLPLQ